MKMFSAATTKDKCLALILKNITHYQKYGTFNARAIIGGYSVVN